MATLPYPVKIRNKREMVIANITAHRRPAAIRLSDILIRLEMRCPPIIYGERKKVMERAIGTNKGVEPIP